MDVQNRVSAETFMGGQNKITHVALTAAVPTYDMKVHDHIVHAISGTTSDDTGIVTLPSVAEAAGMFYMIVATTGATGDDISLYLKETAAEGYDMDADDDHILLFSDGVNWRAVYNGIA